MNTKSMVAGMAIGSLLVVAGLPATQVVSAETDTPMSSPVSGMVGGQEDCHAAMASMMWMMHQHHAMMGDAMMGAIPDSMMGEGMMGASPDSMMGDSMIGDGMMGASPDSMMGEGMMGDGQMGEGMMGASPEPEATTAPPSTAPGDQTPSPDASSVAGHEQHHPSPSPSVTPGPS